MVWSGTKEGRKEEVGVEVGRGESKGRGGSKTEERRSESRLRRVLLIPSNSCEDFSLSIESSLLRGYQFSTGVKSYKTWDLLP